MMGWDAMSSSLTLTFQLLTRTKNEAAVEVILDLAGRNFVVYEVPVPYEEFVAKFKTWADAGGPCPAVVSK